MPKTSHRPTVLTNCEVQSMRMKMVCDGKIPRGYKKYIDKFLAQRENSLDVDVVIIGFAR